MAMATLTNQKIEDNKTQHKDFRCYKIITQFGIPTQYVAGLLPKANATFAPLSIASSTLSSVNSFWELDFSATTVSTECAKLFARKYVESSSATNGIYGNKVPSSAARRVEGRKERSV